MATSRPSQSKVAYQLIKKRIQGKQIRPGDVISENSLAREFGMSRTPVREAVQRFVHEGVLNSVANRGTMMTVITLRDVQETYQIRESLECLAVRLAAARNDVRAARRLLAILERAAGLVEADGAQLTTLDRQFHAEIGRQAGNSRLERLLNATPDVDMLGAEHPHRSATPRSWEEHRAIATAIGTHDAEAAVRTMQEHIRSSARFIATTIFGTEF